MVRLISDHDDQAEDELRPVAISLRNYFAPRSHSSTNNENVGEAKDHHHHHQEDGLHDDNNKNENEDEDEYARTNGNARVTGFSESAGVRDDDNDEREKKTSCSFQDDDEDENDESSYYAYRWSTAAAKGAMHEALSTPLSMEVSVPHSLLVKLKHSYKCKDLRRRVAELFHLDGGDGPHANASHAHGHGHDPKKGSHYEHRYHVVYCSSFLQDRISSHPLWDHLDECLDDLHDELPNGDTSSNEERIRRDRIWKEICNAMRIQCKTIMMPNNSSGDESGSLLTRINHHQNSMLGLGSGSGSTAASSSPSPVLLTSASLNPRQLKQLPKNKDTLITRSDSILGTSKYTAAIPRSLPRNTLVVYFSDGSTRVHPDLYQMLVTKNVITESPDVAAANANDDLEADKFAKRFDDNLFDVLENESNNNIDKEEETETLKVKLKLKSPPISGENSNNNTRHSSFKTAPDGAGNVSDFTKMDVMSLSSLNGHGQSKGKIQKHVPKGGVVHGSFADAFDSLTSSTSGQRSYGASLVSSAEPSDTESEGVGDAVVEEEEEDSMNLNHHLPLNDRLFESSSIEHTFCDRGSIINMDMLDDEIVRLHHVLAAEEESLKREIRKQQKSIECMKEFSEGIDLIRKEIAEIDTETSRLPDGAETIGEDREMLLRELKLIYPIQLLPDGIYTIRGIHLPNDMHSLSASDEIISAGLGFACHVVSMCSKYLSIPLRYRLICNSSRSAVREDDFDVFPLFKERVVEKEQFDRAITLFHRNIDHLLRSKGVSISTINGRKHILAKLSLLFEEKNANGSS